MMMDKQKVVYPHNGIVASHEKGSNTDTCHIMEAPHEYYAKWKKADTQGHSLHLFEFYFIYFTYLKCPN